jgi:hypothetical protein
MTQFTLLDCGNNLAPLFSYTGWRSQIQAI